MKIIFKIFTLLILISHHSNATEISEYHCVKSEIQKVFQLISNYNEYSTMKGSKYSVVLAGTEIDLIQMVKSQSRQLLATELLSEDLVWIVLQPALINDAKMYPRFLLNCKINWIDRNSFMQNCSLQKDKQHFGLSDLKIYIFAQANDSLCKAGSSGIKIKVNIEGNSFEINQIKRATLGPADILAPLISVFFDEDTFFRNYFKNIYDQWIKAL